MTSRNDRAFGRGAAGRVALAAALVAGGALALAASTRAASPAVPPVVHAGQFVWYDLLSPSPSSVEPFYAGLFGWTFEEQKGQRDLPYRVIRSAGVPIGGIIDVSTRKAEVPESVWLSFLSVPDVDAAAAAVVARKGRQLKEPVDLGTHARAAVVADPAGALVGLVRLRKGDPPETVPTVPGRFLWQEYVAEDAESAVAFYRDVFGYAPERADGGANVAYWALKAGGVARAGLYQSPWPKVRSNWLPYVLVADAAAAAEKVKALGGKVLLAPRPDVRAGTLAIVTDPAGAAIALQVWPIPAPAKQ